MTIRDVCSLKTTTQLPLPSSSRSPHWRHPIVEGVLENVLYLFAWKNKNKKLYAFLILKDKGLNFSGYSINSSLFLIKFAIDTVTTCTWWELATLACHLLPHPFCRWPLSYEIHSQTHVCSLGLTRAVCVIMGSWLSFLGLIPLPRSEQQFGWHCFPREWSWLFQGAAQQSGAASLTRDERWKPHQESCQ